MAKETRSNRAPKAKYSDAFGGMPDKPTVVGAAVSAQLHHEGHWPPNDVTKVMSTDYGYDQFSIGNFLTKTQWNLEHGSPPYTFTFDSQFGVKALSSTVGALMVAIDANTTESDQS